jgi:hypothetical protein
MVIGWRFTERRFTGMDHIRHALSKFLLLTRGT